MGLKGLQPQAGDSAKLVGESKVVETDPVFGQLYQWELEYQRRKLGRGNGPAKSPSNGHGNGQVR